VYLKATSGKSEKAAPGRDGLHRFRRSAQATPPPLRSLKAQKGGHVIIKETHFAASDFHAFSGLRHHLTFDSFHNVPVNIKASSDESRTPREQGEPSEHVEGPVMAPDVSEAQEDI